MKIASDYEGARQAVSHFMVYYLLCGSSPGHDKTQLSVKRGADEDTLKGPGDEIICV